MQITRRSLITEALGLSVALPVLAHGAWRPRERGEKVLVVVQLSGGNDGLNTVVPHRQDAYYHARPTLGLQANRLHALDEDHGLHPALGELGALYQEGRVACLHGVGYPGPDRSHFRSMEIWHTGHPESTAKDSGWLGRLADQMAAQGSALLPAVHIGAGSLPLSMRGEQIFAPTVRDAEAFRLHEKSQTFASQRSRLLDGTSKNAELNFLRQAASTTYSAARSVQSIANDTQPRDYPRSDLGKGLNLIARLVAGGFGARVFQIELGGFDTHVRQARNHEQLLGDLSRSLGAFHKDLEEQQVSQDVCTLVFSEFGRRVAENGSKGTDHGAAAPCFLIGKSVTPGMHGRGPDLANLSQGDVPFTTDFRSIYACLEKDWMGLAASSDVPPLALVQR